MGRVTKVETLNLQTFATDLKAKGLSDAKIAAAITKRAGQPVSRDIVTNFFRGRAKAKVAVVEKKDKLAAKMVEAEYNTLRFGMECLTDLKEVYALAISEGDLRAAILAIGEMHKGLDIMNKTLGKYQVINQNQFNFNEVNFTESHEKIAGRITSIAARLGTIEDTQEVEQ